MHKRRYELDWLRVLAFALLIFYHIGMLYVKDWGFHYKSQYQSEFLQNIMLLVNPWRLPLLFLISGVAVKYYLDKTSVFKFIGMRSIRLLIPLAFAMLVIIPPQLYVEMIYNGDLDDYSYWQFYKVFLDFGNPLFDKYQRFIYQADVNHLWYIRELWWFSVYLIILTPLLNSGFIQSRIDYLAIKQSPTRLILVPLFILSVLAYFVFPDNDEGYRVARGFSFMIVGYLLGWNHGIWEIINKYRRVFLYLSILSASGYLTYNQLVWKPRVDSIDGTLLGFAEYAFSYFNRWVWILMILGYGSCFLNKPSPKLKYLNEAIYPYYILHQSILIMVAYYLTPLVLGGFYESFIVIVATIFGCAAGYELIRRFNLLRVLFGLRLNSATIDRKDDRRKQGI